MRPLSTGSRWSAACVGLLLVVFATPASVWSQEDEFAAEPAAPSAVELQTVLGMGDLTSRVGTGSLVTVPAELERVALADERIGRVQIISPREFLLTGLIPGRTTVHVWLADGTRLQYYFQVVRDLDLVRRTLQDLDPRISVEAATDGTSVVLRGQVDEAAIARAATARARAILSASGGGPAEVLNLLRYPGYAASTEELLERNLKEIDPRIRVRRIQVGETPEASADTFVLEGRVRDVQALVQAVMLAERQLGGTGGKVSAAEAEDRITSGRARNFLGSFGSFGGGFGGGSLGTGSGANSPVFRGTDPRSSSITAQLARGLVLTSESGRVVSLLEVDELPQVLVSIRVLEVDRTKARKVGFNFRFDAEHVSIGNYTSPVVDQLPAGGNLGGTPSIDGITSEAGNFLGAFVDQTLAITSAIDLMTQKNLARAVAEPNVLTLSGELASVLVGGEVPIPTTAVNQVTSLQGFFFQDFGVRLDIRPTVTNADLVSLEVAPSIVRVAPGLAVGEVPGFQVQSVTTTAQVRAGQSLLIGGLLSFEDGLEERRIPGLGVLPFFRWKNRTRQERELLFLITPRLVDTSRTEQVDPVVEPPDPAELDVPELDWPRERRAFRDARPAKVLADGTPESLRIPELYEELYSDEYGEYDEDDSGLYNDETFVSEGEDEGYEPDDGGMEEMPAGEPEMMEEEAPIIMMVVADPCLRLRAEAGTWSEVIGCVDTYTRVEVVDESDGWLRVVLPDGQEGWMSGAYLQPAVSEPEEFEEEGAAAAATVDPAPLDPVAVAEAGQGELEDTLEEIRAELERIRSEELAEEEGSLP